MEWPDVQRRIVGGEDARTEFNRGVGDLSGVGRTLCAFANARGYALVLGVSHRTRRVTGIPLDVHEK